MIDLNEVGAHVIAPGKVRFGLPLPEITAAKGYQVRVRIIHELDQFTPEIPPRDFDLAFDSAHPLALWSATIDVKNGGAPGNFGNPGRYFYRYRLLPRPGETQPSIVTSLFTDPFARNGGPARLSSFTIDNPASPAPPFDFDDAGFRVPSLDDMVVYELRVAEFYSTFQGVIPRLDYLAGLGVNVLELLPVTDFPQVFDWGYGPLQFFAPEDRWGGATGLKRLVKEAHKRNIAVILDVVYQHCSADFAYVRVYRDSGEKGPMGDFPDGPFGPEFTYNGCPFTQDFFRAANRYWLEEYHIDGFRYDYVKGFFSGAIGPDYANVVYQTYQDSAGIARFQDPAGYRRILQVAEFIDANPQIILFATYSNATWQDNLLNKAADMAKFQFVDDSFAHLLDPSFLGYPNTRDFDGVQGPVAPFQYLESHDHSNFICSFRIIHRSDDIPLGDRSLFYKTQPYAIALYTCQGIPMLWQGQEFCENYVLPGSGTSRIQIRRDVHWEYFYDEFGFALIRVYRRMAAAQALQGLRGRHSFYFNANSNLGGRAIAYSRRADATAAEPEQTVMVFLNFSDFEQSLTVPFPMAGTYREMLDDDARGSSHLDLTVTSPGESHTVKIPSNYGQVYVSPALSSL